MSVIWKNFLTTIRRFTTSVVLNVVGLTVAFAAALVIIMQVSYDLNYDSDLPQSDATFRVALNTNEFGSDTNLTMPQQLVDLIQDCSPHVRYCSLCDFGMNLNGRVVRDNGSVDIFPDNVAYMVYPDWINILGLQMIEGDTSALRTPGTLVIPELLARKVWPNQPALGNMIDSAAVSGVYRDRKSNSVVANNIYFTRPRTWKNNPSNWNYFCLVTLDSPSSREAFEQAANGVLKKYFDQDKSDEQSSRTIPTVHLNRVRDLYYCHEVRNDIGGQGNRTTTAALLLVAILIVLIAVINFVNFASAQSPMRMKSINMQKIMGARVAGLRLGLMFESVMLSLFSYALALVVVLWAEQTSFAELFAADLSFAFNLRLILCGVAVALLVGVAAGIYPALYMTSFPPILSLKGSFGMSAAGRRYRSVLVALQFVVSIALIVVSLFVWLQIRYMSRFDTGYERDRVLCTYIPADTYFQKHTLLTEKIRSCAEFEDVAYATARFGQTSQYMGWGRGFRNNQQINFNVMPVSRNFLDVLGIKVVEGRNFTESDEQNFYGSAIFTPAIKAVDSLQLGEHWGDLTEPNSNTGVVVGFVGNDVRTRSLRYSEEPFAFYLWGTENWGNPYNYVYVRMRDNVGLKAGADALKAVLRDVEPAAEFSVEYLDDMVNRQYRNEMKQSKLITIFSIVAVLIALTGVFGLVLFETQYRRKEIGIRRVHGATVGEILAMFNRKFLIIVGVCFVVAAPLGYYAVSVWQRSFANRVPLYWWVYVVALLIVALITVVTVTIRSWHAANEDPAHSIKTE